MNMRPVIPGLFIYPPWLVIHSLPPARHSSLKQSFPPLSANVRPYIRAFFRFSRITQQEYCSASSQVSLALLLVSDQLSPKRRLPPFPDHIPESEKGSFAVSPPRRKFTHLHCRSKGNTSAERPLTASFRCNFPSCRREKTRRHRYIFV